MRRLVPCRICTVAFHVECVPMKYGREDEEKRRAGNAGLARLWLPRELGGPTRVDEGARKRGFEALSRARPVRSPPCVISSSGVCDASLASRLPHSSSRLTADGKEHSEIDTPLLYCDKHHRRDADPRLGPISGEMTLWYPLNEKCAAPAESRLAVIFLLLETPYLSIQRRSIAD